MCIDACMLGRTDSTFLQQAAHLTGGVYLRPRHKGALLQYLLVCVFYTSPVSVCLARAGVLPCSAVQTVYSGDGFSRGFLELPQQVGVDFRASCFCHRVSAYASSHLDAACIDHFAACDASSGQGTEYGCMQYAIG